jgi:threonine dehydratase
VTAEASGPDPADAAATATDPPATALTPAQAEDLRQRVTAAEERLAGHRRLTPLLGCDGLDALSGATCLLKCENLQRTGSFKFRGAYNALSALLETQPQLPGVLTYSSGNHAQALSLAGRLLGVPVTVVMPANAPAVKREATRANGAEVIEYDPAQVTREALGAAIAEERGLPVIPPYDHLDVIAGQATVGLEMLAQAESQAGPLDYLLVCTGGGGLLGGIAFAVAMNQPKCKVIGVEPALADDATRSFRTRTLQRVHNPPTIADGTRTPYLGQHNFPLVMQYVHDMVTVSEDAIVDAVRLLFREARLVVEPSGALATAAMLAGALTPPAGAPAGARVGLVISGGNVDANRYAALVDPQASGPR